MGRFDQFVQQGDLFDGQLAADHLGHHVQVRAGLQEISRRQIVADGGGTEGERTRIFINAHGQDRGFIRPDRHLLSRQDFGHQAGVGSDRSHHLHLAVDVIGIVRVMIVKVDNQIGVVQNLFQRADSLGLPGVHHNQALDLGHVDVLDLGHIETDK